MSVARIDTPPLQAAALAFVSYGFVLVRVRFHNSHDNGLSSADYPRYIFTIELVPSRTDFLNQVKTALKIDQALVKKNLATVPVAKKPIGIVRALRVPEYRTPKKKRLAMHGGWVRSTQLPVHYGHVRSS